MASEARQKAIVSLYNAKFHRNYKYSSTNKQSADWAVEAAARAVGKSPELYEAYRKVNDTLNKLQELGKITGELTKDFMSVKLFCDTEYEEQLTSAGKAEASRETTVSKETEMNNEEKTSLAVLGQVISGVIQNMGMDEIRTEALKQLKDETAKWIQDTYGPIQKSVTVVVNGNKTVVQGVVHEKFDDVIKMVAGGVPVFLTGPAGSGKNVLCQQIAQCLGLDFYFSNAVTQEYKILGFTDANGVYQETQFYKAFKNGGLFMLDEMDASNPDVLNILNAAIANKYQDFPAPIGFVKAHPNFRLVAAGNTYGMGVDYDYVGRTQLDAATLNRFFPVEIGYDPRIEESVALGKTQLLEFCRKFRQACKDAGIRTIVSYRNIGYMAQLDDQLDTKTLVKGALIKGMERGDIQMIRIKLSGFGKYSAALDSFC